MNKRTIFLLAAFMLLVSPKAMADNDYKESKRYEALLDSMRHAFNDADSARFYPALKDLEDYLLTQNDLHAYYTQRCNEIIFLMNQQKIFEAYKLGRQLSIELREKKLDKEMYMAYNMLGHINRYCGNREAAKRCFNIVIEMMEKEGYYESMPPIYMNIVNVEMGDNPEEAIRMLNKAKEIAEKYAPKRVFDIETRRTLSYYNNGDMKHFVEGYKAYKKGVEEGQSSVHGRTLEVYYEAYLGNTDKAVALAKENLGDEGHDAITMIYEKAGRWKEAYESLREQYAASDSINNVILTNSMQGIRDQLMIYDTERETARNRTIVLAIGILLLTLLVAALTYIVLTRRKHMREMQKAYQHALESDRMKTAFIQNVSHEVRTPLNIISGFAQVLSDPELDSGLEDRQKIANMMLKNAKVITSLIDEMLELSVSETSDQASKDDQVKVNALLRRILKENESFTNDKTKLHLESSLSDDFCLATSETMLKRIVSSLVDNAVKNTVEGGVTLKATADGKTLTMTVEDTGKGIPKEEAERIFERFVKLDTFKEGMGLGLTLCRSMATRLGGTVNLDTTYDKGARFIVKLPIEI